MRFFGYLVASAKADHAEFGCASVVFFTHHIDSKGPASAITAQRHAIDQEGEVPAEGGQVVGVAVLNIEASKDGAVGQGIIKVEQETISEETVFIQ